MPHSRKRLTFITPQALAVKAWHAQTQQLHQLQEMNTAQYFERLGQAISPSVGGAISEAVYPLTEKFEASIQRMEQISQTGTAGLMEDFSKAIHGGAGRELQELSSVLAQTTEASKEFRVACPDQATIFLSKFPRPPRNSPNSSPKRARDSVRRMRVVVRRWIRCCVR